jgi:SAM-dependent methyltransferase
MASVLTALGRSQRDESDDGDFYDSPRFVTHADDGFVERLTDIYDSVLSPGDRIFDCMSSWVSHLPAEDYGRTVGHGLNEAELKANDALDEWFVQDLNREQSLPFPDDVFDAVLCALSVQYLQYPGALFSEFNRILSPGGHVVISFTNRMFPTKAVRAWRVADMAGRTTLVEAYCQAGGLTVIETIEEQPENDPLVAVIAQNK